MKLSLNFLPRRRSLDPLGPSIVTAPAAEEPCLSCGEPTAVGTSFFLDRHDAKLADGTKVFLCADCQARAHRARKGHSSNGDDLHATAENAGMLGAGVLSGHSH
jgi:hypothetical protein